MNFQDVDIPVLAKFISEITGKNFVIDESVRGKVSIISPTKVTPQQAYSIFQSVLQLKGFATVQAGPVVKIVPARQVRETAALTTSQEPGELRGDEYVTRMVKLKNIDAASLVSVVQPMVSHDGLVAAYPEDNTLILTDNAYNIQRLLKIIGSLDVQGVQQNIEVIPLKLAFAADVASQIEKIMSAKSEAQQGVRLPRPGMGVVAPAAQGPTGGFKVVPDERTNSLIVLAGPLQMRTIKDLVAKLDIHPPNETTRIHVVHLKNASAAEIVQVLNGLLGGSGAPTTLSPVTGRNSLGRGSALGNYSGGFGSGFGGLGFSGMGGGLGGYGGLGATSFGGYGANSAFGGAMGSPMGSRSSSAAASGPISASTGGGTTRSPDFENPVTVTADPATNSLIVSASPQDYQTLRQVIEQLDIPRIQVFVQAIIVEVSAQRTRDIGVNFQSASNISGSTLGVAQLNFGQLQTALANPLGITGLGIGLASASVCSIPVNLAASVTNTLTSGATGTVNASSSNVSVPCDVALMTALESDTHSNVLSAPTLLTADNEEAMIVVGQNLPFVGSAAANAGLPGQIFNSVDRQNVGITLDIIPQVSEGDYVRLDVYEEVSNVVNTPQSVNNPLGPTTTIRSASTTVMVQDHRTAVIGGLLSDQNTIQRQGVPFFSDIPVLGNLFSDNGSNKQKLNLLVFLTPHVVRTREDLRSLALDERQRFIDALGRREMHQMPVQQFRQLNQPSFSVPVSPAQDLQSRGAMMAPSAGAAVGFGSAPSSLVAPPPATPPNTEIIGPGSKNAIKKGAGSSVAAAPASTSGTAPLAASASAATASPPAVAASPPSPSASSSSGFGSPSPLGSARAPAIAAEP
ncbi:MAG TPA: type II secretion system secretin GspD [Candidatus Binataceae bacterium]|nr:type II secretion system secretin GspD [Candidatus Binataceae bacterium]